MMLREYIKKLVLDKRLKNFSSHGNNVWVGSNCHIQGNVLIGSNVNIGRGSQLISTLATIHIHDYVVIGPEVAIYSGDHAIDTLGKHIIEITDLDKRRSCNGKKYDRDVIVESGCWIGTRAIILKGVTIGRGSIIGAGSVLTKDVPPYSIYCGVPQRRLAQRFSNDQIAEHERILRDRGLPIQ